MRYLASMFLSMVIICMLWAGLFYIQLGKPTTSSKWIADVYDLKDKIAGSFEGKKIVFTSGSNALFGLDSRVLTAYWEYPVVNYSVHAGLQLPYILERSKRILENGDIVILPLEYSMYQYDGRFSEVLIDYIVSRDIKYYFSLPFHNKFMVITQMHPKRLWNGLKYYFKEKDLYPP